MTAILFNPALASGAQLWGVIILSGIITYSIRLSFILVFGQREIPLWLKRALRFVPPSVLTAIVFPELLINGGKFSLAYDNTRLIAGIVAILVAWRTKNAVLTIIVGMGVLWLMQWLLTIL